MCVTRYSSCGLADQGKERDWVSRAKGEPVQVLTLLNEARVDYEVVNVLDDLHNPGLRETIKTYSQWPTIPQA